MGRAVAKSHSDGEVYNTVTGINAVARIYALASSMHDGGYSVAMGAKGVPMPAPYQIVAVLVDKMLEKGIFRGRLQQISRRQHVPSDETSVDLTAERL